MLKLHGNYMLKNNGNYMFNRPLTVNGELTRTVLMAMAINGAPYSMRNAVGLFRLLRLGGGRTKYNDYLCSVIGIMPYAKGNNRLVCLAKAQA